MSKKSKKGRSSKEKSFKKTLKKTMKTLTKKEKTALQEAASVLWLSDSSDYINGLWDVVRTIVGADVMNHEDFDLEKILDKESDD